MTTRFPSSFRTLITHIGTGSFGRGLVFRNPAAVHPYFRLDHESVLSYAQSIESIPEGVHDFPHLYPDAEGLVPIGSIDRQVVLLEPRSLHVACLDLDLYHVSYTELDFVEFVLNLMSGLTKNAAILQLHEVVFSGDHKYPFFYPGFVPDAVEQR